MASTLASESLDGFADAHVASWVTPGLLPVPRTELSLRPYTSSFFSFPQRACLGSHLFTDIVISFFLILF